MREQKDQCKNSLFTRTGEQTGNTAGNPFENPQKMTAIRLTKADTSVIIIRLYRHDKVLFEV